MGMCWCEMMIVCEVKIRKNDEFIENARRKGGKGIGIKIRGRKGVEWRNKGMGREDYSSVVKRKTPLNTPSSRDSIEFEYKNVTEKWLMEWKRMKGREDERGKSRNGDHWKDQMGGRQNCWSGDGEKKCEERNGWNEVSLKIKKI